TRRCGGGGSECEKAHGARVPWHTGERGAGAPRFPLEIRGLTPPARRHLKKARQSPLKARLSRLYSARFALTLRRDRPQMRAQRPTLPRVFVRALRRYCCSIRATASRTSSGSGRSSVT